jgi:hypothetical protein
LITLPLPIALSLLSALVLLSRLPALIPLAGLTALVRLSRLVTLTLLTLILLARLSLISVVGRLVSLVLALALRSGIAVGLTGARHFAVYFRRGLLQFPLREAQFISFIAQHRLRRLFNSLAKLVNAGPGALLGAAGLGHVTLAQQRFGRAQRITRLIILVDGDRKSVV